MVMSIADVTDENVSEGGCSEPRQPSLDEMLTTSGVMNTPALDPEPAPRQSTTTR